MSKLFDDQEMLDPEESVLSMSYEDGSDDCVFDIDEDPNSQAKWYVIHTYSGHEKKVKSSIEKIVESKGMGDQVLKVNVPTQKIVTVKNAPAKKSAKKKKADSEGGEKVDSDIVKSVRDRIIFPGYVFVKMIHNDKTWFLVRNTRGVTGFVGAGKNPTPLTRQEMEDMQLVRKTVVSEFEVGEEVEVTEGYLRNNIGVVSEIYPEKQMLKVLISALNNATAELEFSAVTKIKK